jgi:hypothetical protein
MGEWVVAAGPTQPPIVPGGDERRAGASAAQILDTDP